MIAIMMFIYYKMEIIPSKKLIDICKKMGWDYIKLFHQGINTQKELSENEHLKASIAHLNRENELLQEQVEQLKYMVGMLKKKPATKK